MICSLSLSQGVVQQMPYLSQVSCRKNFLQRTKINNLHLSNWRRLLAGFLSTGYIGLYWFLSNGYIERITQQIIQAMHCKVRIKASIENCFNDSACWSESWLRPQTTPFYHGFEAISLNFINGCPWELLYGDDLVIIAESVEELCRKLTSWKAKLENKSLRVNMRKISHV